MASNLTTWTAAQIAAALGIKPQSVRGQLAKVPPAGVRIVNGNEAAAWTVEQLPAPLRERLAVMAHKKKCRTIQDLLSMPRCQLPPRIPLAELCAADVEHAKMLREALKPFLISLPDAGLTAEEWKQRGVDYYFRVFKARITTHHWDRLFRRTQERDNGCENWDELPIYLADRLKRKAAPASPAAIRAGYSQDFAGLNNFLRNLKTPGSPDKEEIESLWRLSLTTYQELLRAGEREKRAARRIRKFLFERAAFPTLTKDALWIAFKRKISTLKKTEGDLMAIKDGRAANGDHVEIPAADIDRLRHSSAIENGGRVDAAWREEYSLLSEATRLRYADSFKAPAKIHDLLKRELVDAIAAAHHDKRKLRRMCGTLERDWTGVPSMHSWVADDMTVNLEVCLLDADGQIVKNDNGTPLLFTPQIIGIMDSAARKIVGLSISTDKAPNAGLVCDAFLNAAQLHGVPKRFDVERGFVFGKSLLVNGKEDEQGRAMVIGLGNFGCTLGHFEGMSPTSKSELEYGFHQLQCLMERHPGYTGRLQILNAPGEFKREQRLIRAGKEEATKFRYTFDEFITVCHKIVAQYNATVQRGRLNGLSPDKAFLELVDSNGPITHYSPKLEWLFNEREIVRVGVNGVRFLHRSTRTPIKVRGGELANLIGEELWAVTGRRDPSMVTFMDRNFSHTFTMEVCQKVHARQSSFEIGSDRLAKERTKLREHERAIIAEYQRLKTQFGDPRRDLLAEIRKDNPPVRHVMVPGAMEEAGEQMKLQRAEISAARELNAKRMASNKSKARRAGVASVLADESEQTSRALELMSAGRGAIMDEISTEENEA